MKFDIYNDDKISRFVLGKAGTNSLAIFGINPSTANQCKSDPTIDKIEKLIKLWNFNGFLMFNLYPLRASKPKNLPARCDADLLKQNLEAIHGELEKSNAQTVWAAWGNAFDQQTYFTNCLDKILSETKASTLQWKKCESLTKSGNPRHPLSGHPHVITGHSQLTDFSVHNYLDGKRKKIRIQ